MNIKKVAILAGLCAAATLVVVAGTDNVAEEVAWVVGDQPIWKSDIEEAYQQMLAERMPVNGDPYCVIPEQLAVEKLYLHQADLDTVEVQPTMISQQVESQLNYYVANLGSKEKVEQMFRKSFPEMREKLTEMLTNRSRIQQVQMALTKDIKTTPADVRRYFQNLPADSVPYVPLTVETQILTLSPAIPRQEIEDVKARLRDYADRINRGESDFSTLAILYSEDGSSSRGGETGFMGRGQMVPEYAAVAFNLTDPKKVSKIVETEFGFHIIQLIEKRGDRINTRHILLRPKVSDKDLTEALERLDTLRNDIVVDKKGTFEQAVALLSQDKDTRNNRGIMVNDNTGTTRFEMSQLPPEVARAVAGLQPGEISKPFMMKDQKLNRDVVAMVKLTSRLEGHKANLADDYQQISAMYEDAQRSKMLADWRDKKIADSSVRIEDNWRNCEFTHKGWIKEKQSSANE